MNKDVELIKSDGTYVKVKDIKMVLCCLLRLVKLPQKELIF